MLKAFTQEKKNLTKNKIHTSLFHKYMQIIKQRML